MRTQISATGISFTASERRSLRALRIPRSLQSECGQAIHSGANGAHNTGTPQREISPRRPCSQFFDNGLSLLLEDATLERHWLNPKAIVAVGESVSFAHLPGVGTRWRVSVRRENHIQRKCLYLELGWLIFQILLPTRAHEQWVRRWRQFVLPYPPPPRTVQRKIVEEVQAKISPNLLTMLQHTV
jgi:hypothetical protein